MPAPAAGAAAAAAGGGGCGGAFAGTEALAPAPGALFASRQRAVAPPGPRCHSGSPVEGRHSQFLTGGDSWRPGDPWSPAFRGGIRAPPGSLPPLPARSRPLPAAPPASVLPSSVASPRASSKVSEECLQRSLVHLKHWPPLPALGHPGKTLRVSRFRTNVKGGKY